MKPEELMIGDWIRLPKIDNEPDKVQRLRNNDLDTETMNKIGYDEIEPIFITNEILEKNGFRYLKNKRIYYDTAFGLEPMKYGDFTFYRIENTRIIIGYVHQLQHILKLCGINNIRL